MHPLSVTGIGPANDLLGILGHAHRQAVQAGLDPWQFAVELDELGLYGVGRTDLRTLVVRGLVAHAVECKEEQAGRRSFRPAESLRFTRRTCFVITAAGLRTAADSPPLAPAPDLRPAWRPDTRELWWAERVVKQFRQPADNQELLLGVFEEEGWPARIDDPLPASARSDGPTRLRETVKSLNRGLLVPVVRFAADGTGQGVRWEPTGN